MQTVTTLAQYDPLVHFVWLQTQHGVGVKIRVISVKNHQKVLTRDQDKPIPRWCTQGSGTNK